MIPEPLHPAIVHFPIVLAVLLPIAAAAAVVAIHRGASVVPTWTPVVVLAVLLAGSAWAAVETGKDEEERVEVVVPEAAIEDHEEAAELFLPLSAGVLGLIGLGLLKGGRGRTMRYVATVGAIGLLAQGIRVGHSGGELVYVHGAASAYGSGVNSSSGSRMPQDEAREREHEDERR